MIIGIGTDLVEIDRIEQAIARQGERFLARIFTPAERAYCDAQARPAIYYAARFAAKEAFSKALSSGIARGLRWTEIEIERGDAGQPTLNLTGHARDAAANLAVTTIHVTLTHTRTLAQATVILEG